MRKIRRLRSRGFLTRKELELLEEASQKEFKPKKPAQKYACEECDYHWLYKSIKCPTCSSIKVKTA